MYIIAPAINPVKLPLCVLDTFGGTINRLVTSPASAKSTAVADAVTAAPSEYLTVILPIPANAPRLSILTTPYLNGSKSVATAPIPIPCVANMLRKVDIPAVELTLPCKESVTVTIPALTLPVKSAVTLPVSN